MNMCKECGCQDKQDDEKKDETPEEKAEDLVKNTSEWAGQDVGQVAQLIREGSVNGSGH